MACNYQNRCDKSTAQRFWTAIIRAMGQQKRSKRTFTCETKSVPFFPESVWAQGSSNSGGLYLIFSSSHLLMFMLEQPFCTKWGSIVKNWGKIANFLVPEQPFRTKWGSMRKNWGKIANLLVPDLSRSNPFARNEGRSSKTAVKLRFYLCWNNPFARNEGRSSKTEEKLRIYLCRTCPGATLSHEMRVDTSKIATLLVLEQLFRTKRCCV